MFTNFKSGRYVAVAAAAALLLAACGTGGGENDPGNPNAPQPATGETITLDGAGATFPTPLWQALIDDYTRNVNPNVRINYQSIGSGGGITQFKEQTVQFGSSERFLSDEDLADVEAARGCPAVQLPAVYGSVVIAFSDDQFDGLVLTADVIARVFDRDIVNFNDPAIAALNPGVDLPDVEIAPVHRSDGSGTTNVFTLYLEDEVPMWADKYGSGTEVNWAAGTIGGQGNEGVAAGIIQNPGGFGYVNQSYAIELGLPQAQVVNADGNAIYPTLEATSAGLDGLEIPESYQFSILGIGGEGYPITGAVWNFFYECGYTDAEAAELKAFWAWALGAEGDAHATELGYAPLGQAVKDRVLADLERINASN
ncbi:MAG: phosphate ABC transporter substrate-binding protein PstS [Actinobacteria bacterium HGW-Actinobacteria-4]|nr:MAG: phosphate ABC transporter substrate-binding protein PstS [Actinobacteria bacterium HGW-Actinobacteria-4]